jgi:hypothetical protein
MKLQKDAYQIKKCIKQDTVFIKRKPPRLNNNWLTTNQKLTDKQDHMQQQYL